MSGTTVTISLGPSTDNLQVGNFNYLVKGTIQTSPYYATVVVTFNIRDKCFRTVILPSAQNSLSCGLMGLCVWPLTWTQTDLTCPFI